MSGSVIIIDRCGDISITASEPGGISVLVEALQSRDIEVRIFRDKEFIQTDLDCDCVFIAYPTVSFNDTEITALHRYVNNGGGLFLIGEWGNTSNNTSILNTIADKYSVTFNPDRICDPQYFIRDGFQSKIYDVKVFNLRQHPITRGVREFRIVAACSLNAPYDNVVAWASKASFGDLDFDSEQDAYEAGQYLPVMAAVEYGRGRVAFIGDLSFMSNQHILNMNNGQLVINVILYLMHRL
ncbi:MAG: hypothetical protein QF415_09255 [Candidatus Undinarchaeales archaeon]|jgi:hypothetical protein|nr:hypothetical protein [Candidatus Undinarchaeales archaeon]MDP7493009.1 hypothetical protein [Candidatus Undinarchaeales archaeon]